MLERVWGELTEPAAVGRRVQGETPRERFVATCALALAAQRAGRAEEARALLEAAATRAPDLTRGGGAATFWWLATGAYGVFGGAPAAELRAAGTEVAREADAGLALAAAPAGRRFRAAVDVTTGRGALFVRSEVVYGRPFRAEGGPLGLTLRSGSGAEAGTETVRLGVPVAFELSIAPRRDVARPVVELALPVGGDATEPLLQALRQLPAVARAERRAPGFLRLELAPLRADVEALVALPLRFTVRGTVRGLAMSGYDRDAPADRTVVTGRALRVE